MKLFKNLAIAGLACLAAATSQVHAASMSLINAPGSVNVGDSFTVDVFGDFSDVGLLIGGVFVQYDDSLLSVDDVTITVASDPSFTCPDTCHDLGGAGNQEIAWGDFGNIFDVGEAGAVMATISLTALNAGSAVLGIINDPFNNLTSAGGSTTFATAFNGTTVDINSTVIPVPAAVWLFGSGLLGLVGVARRKAA